MAGCIYTIDGQKFTEEGVKKYIADNIQNYTRELGIAEVSKQAAGITHAANEIRRRALGMEEYDKETLSIEEANKEAESILAKGDYNVDDLLDKATRLKDVTPVETEILKITMATLDAEIAKNPTNDLINKQKRLIRVSDIIGSEAGRKLAFRKGMAQPMSTISEFYVDKMEKNNVNELTKQQMAEAKADFEKQQAHENDVAEKKAAVEKFESDTKATGEAADKNFQEEKKKSTKSTKGKRDYAAEKKSIIDNIKNKWKKAGNDNGTLLAVPLPISPKLVKQLYEVSPDVAKLMRIYIDEGASKLSEVVDKIYDDIKDVDGIKKQHIYDIIAGKYTKQKPTKTELERKVADLKIEAKLLGLIEDVKNGIPKTEREERQKNQTIAALQKQLYDLKKATPGYYDISKLNAAKAKVQSDTKKILDDIANNNFSAKPKTISIINDRELRKRNPKLYNEYLDAIDAKDKAKHKYEMKMAEERLNSMATWRKRLEQSGNIGKETLNTIKALKAGIDNSAVFVQSSIAVMNPLNIKATVKALASQPSQFISEAEFRRRIVEVHENKPLWNMIEQSGLDFIDPRGYSKSVHEEPFGGKNLLERVKLGKDLNLAQVTTAPFERLFTGFTNEFRLQLFIKGANELIRDGMTIENSPEDYKSLASYINNITGRGKVHKSMQGQVENVISGVIWAPKLMASSLNMIGLGEVANIRGVLGVEGAPKGYYSAMTPRMRAYAIKNTAAGIATGITLMAMYALQPNKKVDYDPESVTFGQVLDTKTGWSANIFGRLTPIVRYLTMMTMGTKKVEGENIPFDYTKETIKFIRGKMAPVPGILTDAFITHKDFNGKPYDITKVTASDVIEPMFVKDFRQQMKIDGTQALLNAVPTFYGIKITNEKMYDQRDLPTMIENVQQSKYIDKNLLFNYNDGGRKVTDAEFKEFATKRDNLLKDYVENIYKNGVPIAETDGKIVNKKVDDLTKKELGSEIERLKSLATRNLKKEIFGEKPELEGDVKKELEYMRNEQGIGKQEEN